MNGSVPRAVAYGLLALQGLLGVVSPRRSIRLSTLGYRVAFENAAELEPRPWLVRASRIWGVGALVTGLVGVAVELRAEPDDPDPSLADVLPGGE